MARILYGVAGEGMGHALRSKTIIEYLIDQGHDISIISSNRAYRYLSKHFSHTYEITGLNLIYEQNRVNNFKSVITNLKPKLRRDDVVITNRVIKSFDPDLIISDFEPTVAYMASLNSWKKLFGKNKVPLISLDNQHVITNCKIDYSKRFIDDYLIAKAVIDLFIPRLNVSRYLITSFFRPKISRKNTVFIDSIIRDEIINTQPSIEDHVLVYQTSKSNVEMFKTLKMFESEKFIIYGFDLQKRDKNLIFKKFSEQRFIKDLASSKGVIINGGYTTMSEALFLKKPVLSIPVKKQFEQICNAHYLEKCGYGEYYPELNYKNLSCFLYNLPNYKENLRWYEQRDNKPALRKIDSTIRGLLK